MSRELEGKDPECFGQSLKYPVVETAFGPSELDRPVVKNSIKNFHTDQQPFPSEPE